MQALVTEVDFIEEIRLRRWARENYVAADERDDSWHPVVLDEMRMKELDLEPMQVSLEDELVVHNDGT